MLRRLTLSALPLAAIAMALMASPQAHAMPVSVLNTGNCVGVCGTSAADGNIGASGLGAGAFGYVTTAGSGQTGVAPFTLDSTANDNGSRFRSAAFNVTGSFDAYFNYITTDGKEFSDFGWARLINADNSTAAWLFAARSSTKGQKEVIPGGVLNTASFDPANVIADFANFDFTRLTNPTADLLGTSSGTCYRSTNTCGTTGWLHSTVSGLNGLYRLEVGVTNAVDNLFDSALAFDLVGLGGAAATVPEPGSLGLLLAAGAAAVVTQRRRAV
ncbi:PEP-CTERM putative exosortase interaction domain-containing protein [Burkholderiales bacterium JOSHI_001]|nr:PEP-CTERM putative exosortase interaction domain-containing protein [Burkholderiales bacterium JOSHI_001]